MIPQLAWCDTVMLIRLETLRIGRELLEDVSSLETILCLGSVENGTTYQLVALDICYVA